MLLPSRGSSGGWSGPATSAPTVVVMDDQVGNARARQLRLVVEADDFHAVVEFHRDALGMPEEFFV